MKAVSSYSSLLGKSKKEIIAYLGEAFNFFPSDKWVYLLSTNWLGRKKNLIIHFENNLVIKVEIKQSFFDISNF